MLQFQITAPFPDTASHAHNRLVNPTVFWSLELLLFFGSNFPLHMAFFSGMFLIIMIIIIIVTNINWAFSTYC